MLVANICLVILSRLSKSHSWILPVFAIGLGRISTLDIFCTLICRYRSSTLGANMVGYLQHWSISSLGWYLCFWRTPITKFVALARCP